jgi:hypothetical protein
MAVVPFFVPRAPALAFYKRFCLCFRSRKNRAKLLAGATIRRRGGQRCKPKFKAALALSGLRVTVVGAPKRECHWAGLAIADCLAIDPHHRQHNLAC